MHSGQQKPNTKYKKKGVKWIGKPAGNSGFQGDDGRY